jgi:hypothetical protein
MKSNLFLLSFLMLLSVATNYAQGIAVQGIARSSNNIARVNATLNLTFRIYYGVDIKIYEDTKSVTTDAFGVFSTVLEPTAENNIMIANNQSGLKISEGGTIISNEILKQVPYAIAASNGVPTGSIMPFIGLTAPAGWALCNGDALPTTATALIAMVGTYAPDLKGMFLRGAGEASGYEGPIYQHDIKTVQLSSNKKHSHGVTDPGHTHDYDDVYISEAGGTFKPGGQSNLMGIKAYDSDNAGYEFRRTSQSRATGVTVNEDGDQGESRPINYGVNYIIKL